MITGLITIVLILGLLSSIVYGRKLVKTEKVDAVFGNPERANGGYHWVVAGSCSILLLWLYFSWDIARSFYPNSANELCQVAKVKESVLGINYIFPIEERTLKSTAFIERETKNINNLKSEIEKSALLDQDKNKFIYFLNETELLIISLSDENNLDLKSQNKIDSIANKILKLTEDFQKISYPPKRNEEQERKALNLLKNQTGWGATGMEIPPYPETKRGLKFEAVSKEMNVIVEEFFQIKNENSAFIKKSVKIKEQINNYKDALQDTQEIEQQYLRQISKIYGRVTRSNIFPSNTLDSVQKSVVEFDRVQKKEQGSLKIIDTFLFPTGTIVASASGETCSEQGTGRWLPKPTDTLRIFLHLLKPSEGYKNFPMLWYEMMGVNQIVAFIIPDWVADILPGKYPVHNSDGKVKPNFKKTILDIATGEFKAFSIPIPSGHIWDSFLRVFIGLALGVIAGVPLGLFMGLSRFAKGYFDPVIELYRPVPPLAWAPLIITVFGIDNSGKIFLLFMVSFAIMIVSARAGASGTQLSKIHAAHSLGASKWQILRQVIFPNSLPEILTGIRVAIGVCWGTLVAAEFLAGTTGIGFVENVARKYMQYEHIWITIFVMGMLGMFFDLAMRWIIKKTIPWRGKG
jgi:taurine transport system permease protein